MTGLDDGLWAMSDDFGDGPDGFGLSQAARTDLLEPAGEDLTATTQIPVARTAERSSVSSSVDFDNGVVFGMDPDFDFVGSRTAGAAFELPSRDDVLRRTHRPADRSRRIRPRKEEAIDTTALAASIAEQQPEPPADGLSKQERRDRRIEESRARRAEKAADREANKAAKAAGRKAKKAANDIGCQPPSGGDQLPGSAPDSSRNSRRLLVGSAVCAAVIGVVGGIGYVAFGGDEPAQTSTSTSSDSAVGPTSAAAPATADSGCPSGTDGQVVTGRDAGDLTASGAETIKAFNYAYYTKRSAVDAVGAVMPSSVKPMFTSVANLQSAIDALPTGTTHCLRITSLGDGRYSTELTQSPPGGGEPAIFNQLIQTAQSSGKTLIVSNQAQ